MFASTILLNDDFRKGTKKHFRASSLIDYKVLLSHQFDKTNFIERFNFSNF